MSVYHLLGRISRLSLTTIRIIIGEAAEQANRTDRPYSLLTKGTENRNYDSIIHLAIQDTPTVPDSRRCLTLLLVLFKRLVPIPNPFLKPNTPIMHAEPLPLRHVSFL